MLPFSISSIHTRVLARFSRVSVRQSLASSEGNKRFISGVYPIVVIVAVSALAAVGSLWARAKPDSRPSQSTGSFPSQPLTALMRQYQRGVTPTPSTISVETVTLTPQGFEPAQITPSASRFVLGVDNRLIRLDLSLELLRENNHKMHELKIAKGQIRLRKLLNLAAGSYTLQVVGHPEWRCNIVVPH